MNEETLKSILDNEIDNALGYINTETTEERRNSIKYYNREAYGNEVEGRSTIVTGEVAEAIDGALPQLLRIFTQSDDVVRFDPKSPGDEESAKQATEYCNWVLMSQNPGVAIFHDWFKDALLQKNGIIKVWWEDQTEVNTEKYKDLSEEELALLLSDKQYEVVSQEQVEVGEIPAQPDPLNPDASATTTLYHYNVKVKRVDKKGEVKIQNVPPEEFLVSKKTVRLPESPFCAHRRLVTRSELISMGYNKKEVMDLQSFEDLTYTPERTARFTNGEQPDDMSLDPSMEEIECFECYIRTDFDNDGIAELRRVFYAGGEVLENEEIDYLPFCSICPIPMPHKFFGHSLADRTMDLQMIKSTITRQILDNLYLSNNARMAVVDGQVNLDDMLTVTPGGIVRVKNPQAIVPLSVPTVANQAFPMLSYIDQMQEKRTGITQASQGLDPNILQNTTATAVAMVQNAGAAKIELFARIFAETGVKDLFTNILHLLCKYQDKARVIRLRGKYVNVDPRTWANEYDVSIHVGLGTGNKEQQMAMLSMVLQKQEQILQMYGPANPVVSVGQYRNTLGRFIEAAGFKDSAEFFKEVPPEVDQQLSQPQPPQPDPNAQAAQMLAQVEQMKAQMKSDTDQAKIQADIAIQTVKMQSEREKTMANLALQQAKMELDREKAAVQLQLEQAKLFQETAQMESELMLKERQQLVSELEKAQKALESRRSDTGVADAIMQLGTMINQLQSNQEKLAASMNAPKTVVRDAKGKIIGVKTGE